MNLNLFFNSFYSDLKSLPPPPTASTKIFNSMYQSRESIPVSGLPCIDSAKWGSVFPAPMAAPWSPVGCPFPLELRHPELCLLSPSLAEDLSSAPKARSQEDIWNTEKEGAHLLYPRICKGYGFSIGHIWMWELDCEESWAPKNWCFWTVVLEKTLESPLDCKSITSPGCSLEGMMLKLKL